MSSSLQDEECNNLVHIPPLGQSKTVAELNCEPELENDQKLWHTEKTAGVGSSIMNGISKCIDSELTECGLRGVPPSNSTQIVTPKLEESTNIVANSYPISEPSSVKLEEKNNTSQMAADDFLKPLCPDNSVDVNSLGLDNFATFETSNRPDIDIGENHCRMSDTENVRVCSDASVGAECILQASDECLESSKSEGVNTFKENHSEIKNATFKTDTGSSFEELACTDTVPESKGEHYSSLPSIDTATQLVGKMLKTDQSKVAQSTSGHTPRCVLIQPSEVPTEVQLEKLLSMQSANYDLQCPPKWIEGDMLWAKVSGHPFWPCMVSRCPFSKMYARIKGDTRIVRSYHIQFFGSEAERGWVNEPSLMIFEGKMKFLEMVQQEQTKRKKGKSAYNPFKINISRRHAWNIAVEEAEIAMNLSREERNVQYIFDYIFVNDLIREQQRLKMELQKTGELLKDESPASKLRPGEKRKRVSSERDSVAQNSDKYKRWKLNISTSPVKPFGAESSFDTYYANHRSLVIEQHPDWSTALVFEYLRQKWESEKVRTSKPAKCGSSGTADDSRNSSCVGAPHEHSSGSLKQNKPDSQLLKLLHGDGHKADSSRQGNGSQVSLPRKKGRPPKTVPLGKETEMDAASSLSASTESANGALELGEDKGKFKLAASTNSVRKAGQEPDSQGIEKRGKTQKDKEPYELEIFKLNSTCKIEKDSVCAVCEKNGDVLQCTGPCGQHFHALCISSESQPAPAEQYLCAECTSGSHTCFSCKRTDMETIKCSVNLCGKYYHEDCIRKYRLSRIENKGFICPLHTCATCAVDSVKNPKAVKGRFYRCVRCPTAYHVGDFCVAAGSVNLAGSHIVCSDHFEPNRSVSCHSRLNITWCFICSKGGTLLCCESCPAAFHAECAEVDKTPEEAWFCEDCASGRKPLYGNIVWIKVGSYRWWPGEICHPRHVPMNIQEKPHQVGEFPVRFFGSHDYYWIHKGRVFLFEEGDGGSKEGSSRGLFKIYMKGVKEATEAFKLWMAAKAKKVEQEQERSDKKPAPFKFIKGSIPVGNVQIYKAELPEIPRCDCRPDQDDACTTECLNRVMMYECHPSVCPASEKCHNQRFQKQLYPECEPFKSESRGWGLRCLEDLKKGQFVLEYVGDLIDEEECKRRIAQAHEDNITNFYMLTLDKNRIIDAGPRGNFSRFMNHSCRPNLETQKWTVNGDIRVGFFALCDIPKGSELTFNYNLECLGNEKKACACGSENCSGFLGVRPKATTTVTNEKKIKESRKKRRKKKLGAHREHEDDCFRCGQGGELVMCDKGNCPKVYHLRCLKLTKPPTGKWLCPWHHCDVCGKLATVMCSECPNSFCQAHIVGSIFKMDDTHVCSEHADLLEGILQSLDSCVGDGIDEIKSQIESITSSNDNDDVDDSEKCTDTSMDVDIVKSSDASNAAIGKKDLNFVADAQAKNTKDKNVKVRQRRVKNVKTNVKDASAKSQLPLASGFAVLSGLENNLAIPNTSAVDQKIPVSSASVQYSNQPALARGKVGQSSKPRRRAEVTICRTKARYKARLSSAGAADSKVVPSVIRKPATNLQSCFLSEKLASH